MKNVFSLLIFLFFTIALTAQQEKITITFADGTEIKGIGRIRDNYSILYRKERKAKKEIYSHKTERKARKVTIHTDDGDRQYEYKVVRGTKGIVSVRLLELTDTGKINLYIQLYEGETHPDIAGMSMEYTTVNYYMGKKGDDLVVSLGNGSTYSKKFRKQIASKYFKDCPDLLDKINTKEFFGRRDIKAVIKYYNEKCQ